MVIDEKGLISAMKDAYKGEGYKLAVDEQGGIECVIIAAPLWTVVIRKSELPRKVLGLIAEHTGEISLESGIAYQVKKKETQTEIFSLVLKEALDFHSGEKARRILRRTSLVLGGYPLWQTATEQKMVKLLPAHEDIMNWGQYLVRLIGDDLVMIDDEKSRVYVRCMPSKDGAETERLTHLAKVQWVAE